MLQMRLLGLSYFGGLLGSPQASRSLSIRLVKASRTSLMPITTMSSSSNNRNNSTTNRRKIRVPVLIVGGGPIGLTLALLLQRGSVPLLLIEQQAEATCLPKAHYITNRSMESEICSAPVHPTAGTDALCALSLMLRYW